MINPKMATVGEGTTKGEYCVIEAGAVVGKNCVIGHHVVIHSKSIIGDNVRIDDFAVVGKLPMKAKNSATTSNNIDLESAEIGNNVIIGTSAVIYAGAKIKDNVLVADLATVREDVEIGDKTIIGRGVAIENKSNIGKLCKIETNAYICAYSNIGDNCFVAPCVVTSNDNFAGRSEQRFNEFGGIEMKKGARLGAGTVVLPHKIINEDGFVAAGSVVTRDVETAKVVVGNPAKVLRDVPQNQLLINQKQKNK